MIYKRKCVLDRKEYELEIPLTEEEFSICFHAWQNKDLRIQDAFPMLTPEQREFIMTGIVPEKWNELFGGDDD